jgi:hypothetical protein
MQATTLVFNVSNSNLHCNTRILIDIADDTPTSKVLSTYQQSIESFKSGTEGDTSAEAYRYSAVEDQRELLSPHEALHQRAKSFASLRAALRSTGYPPLPLPFQTR